nr:hypothetical protein [Tanacetum cinerariifolium]
MQMVTEKPEPKMANDNKVANIEKEREVRPDPDAQVLIPYEINGKLYHLTNEEIQAHMNWKSKRRKLLRKKIYWHSLQSLSTRTMTKGTLIFTNHSDLETLTEWDELGGIIPKKKNKVVEDLMTSLQKKQKRKAQELELEIFFLDVFGDEAFQRISDIHKTGRTMKSSVTKVLLVINNKGITMVKAFMAIAKDEPAMGKTDARSVCELLRLDGNFHLIKLPMLRHTCHLKVVWDAEEQFDDVAKNPFTMSSPYHPTSDIEDAFSSNSPDYTPASPDYFPALSGNTSYDLVPIASPTLSLFHDDPYMKVMHAYDTIMPPQVLIPSPIIMPSSLMLSPIFNPKKFFVPEDLLPPKEQVSNVTSFSTDLSNPSQKQAYILVPPSFSVYNPTLPQIFKIGKSSIKMHLKHHEKKIKDILNYLEELSFHRLKKMEERLVNGWMIIQRDFDELKTELEKVRSQISKLQKLHIGQKDKIAFVQFRIFDLEMTLVDIQDRH